MDIKVMFQFEGEAIVRDVFREEFKENCLEKIEFIGKDEDFVLDWDTYDDSFYANNKIISLWQNIGIWSWKESGGYPLLSELKELLKNTQSVVAVIRNDADNSFKPTGKLSIFLEDDTQYAFDMESKRGYGYE